LEQFRLGVLCFSVVAAMPRAAVAVEETKEEAQLECAHHATGQDLHDRII
jgi:hypothetical protein